MSELIGEGDCPYCGKHFKHLERHKCKKAPVEEKNVKEQVIKEEGMLVPSDDYLSAGVHIGTKRKNKFMSKFIYKIRPDGLAIFNVQKINERLKIISDYLSKFKPEEILFVCKRDSGFKPLKMLNHATGIKVITGRYLPGTLTNPNNDGFFEPKVVVVTDVWHDKQALTDAVKSGAVIIALCNSNSSINKVDVILPCNNRGHKSLALIFWIIAREYTKVKGLPFNFSKESFI